MFLEIIQNSQESTCPRVRPAALLKKRHRCLPVNFAKFLRTPFYTKHLWWLLLFKLIKGFINVCFLVNLTFQNFHNSQFSSEPYLEAWNNSWLFAVNYFDIKISIMEVSQVSIYRSVNYISSLNLASKI